MNWKPEGNHTITPNLVVDGGQRAIEFYGRAFGAEVVTRLTMGDKLMHAEVRIGDSTFTLSDEFPDYGFVAPASDSVSQSLLIWVEDVDAAHARAVEAGTTQISEVSTAIGWARCAAPSGIAGCWPPTPRTCPRRRCSGGWKRCSTADQHAKRPVTDTTSSPARCPARA